MTLKPTTNSVFQRQDTQLTVAANGPNRLYRFVLVRRSSWNFQPWINVADFRRRTKLKIVLLKNIIDHTSNTSSLPLDQLSYLLWCKSSSRNLSSILGSVRNFELDNYVADCRRRSKLKPTPHCIPCTTPLLPPDRLSYLLWCKSYLGKIPVILGLSTIELNNGTDDCQESAPINIFCTQVQALIIDNSGICFGAHRLSQLASSHSQALPTTALQDADDDNLAPFEYSDLPVMLEIPPFHNHYLHQAAIVESLIRPSHRLRLLLRLLRHFQLMNYVADCRRRSRLKNKTIQEYQQILPTSFFGGLSSSRKRQRIHSPKIDRRNMLLPSSNSPKTLLE